MQPPCFFVVGPVGHGKTTARERLASITSLKGGSCSDIIYAFLAIRKQLTVDELRQLPKESFRNELIEAGDFLCGSIGKLTEVAKNPAIDADVWCQPSALIRTLYMNGYNIIDGVRRRLELQDAKGHLEWNGVRSLVIHIHDPRKGVIADNSENLQDLADELVVNEGTPDELEAKLKAIVDKHFGVQAELPDPAPLPVIEVPDEKLPEKLAP